MKRPVLIALLALSLAACNHRQPQQAAAPVSPDSEYTGITHYPRAYPVVPPPKSSTARATATVAPVPTTTASPAPALAATPTEVASPPASVETNAPPASTTTPLPENPPAGTSTSTYSTVPETASPSATVAAASPAPTTSTSAATETPPLTAADSTPSPATTLPAAASTDTTTSASDQVVVLDTSFGRIVIALDDFAAPKTCANFRKLVNDGFYNNTIFHRVIPQFIIQGGDPNTKSDNRSSYGQGDPGYTLPPEIKLNHDRGAVAMARLPDAVNPQHYSNGSQFYICIAPCPSLDNQYTVFAHVIAGIDVANRIANVPADRRNDPLERVAMKATLESRDRALRENASSGP